MIGTQIKTMLEAEMKASDEFSSRNFGLAVADDFREIVEETLQSKKISTMLALNPLMALMVGPELSQWMKQNAASQSEENFMGKGILANFEAFKIPMEFLYWGIQIGLKLGEQDYAAIEKLERELEK